MSVIVRVEDTDIPLSQTLVLSTANMLIEIAMNMMDKLNELNIYANEALDGRALTSIGLFVSNV